MLKASAMAYAIFIFVIIGISCYSFVLLGSVSQLHHTILTTQRELIRTNTLAEKYYLAQLSNNNIKNSSSTQDVLNNGMMSQYKVTSWGAFKILKTTTHFKQDTTTRLTMVGQHHNYNTALYLTNYDKPLRLAGKASIRGHVAVPNGILKTGYINDQAFKKVNFKSGKITTSKPRLPKCNTHFNSNTVNNSIVILDTLETPVLHHPFSKETVVLSTTQKQLYKVHLKGNIKLRATDSLYINGNCELEDIIIEAPKVVFGKGFKGTVQVFAKEHVSLNKNVTLLYPSCIYIKNANAAKTIVTLNENSKLIGGLVINDEEYVGNTLRLITVEKDAEIIGNVYCNGSLDLKGKITGSVFVDRFYLKTTAGIYENYIKDGQINALELPKIFVGVPLFNSTSTNTNYETIKYL